MADEEPPGLRQAPVEALSPDRAKRAEPELEFHQDTLRALARALLQSLVSRRPRGAATAENDEASSSWQVLKALVTHPPRPRLPEWVAYFSPGQRGRWLLQGLPALVLLSGIAWASRGLSTPGELVGLLRAAADDARDRGDHASARTLYQRLRADGHVEPDVQFELARCLEALGHDEAALRIMARIGPPDEPGFGPAHLWLGRRLVEQARAAPGQAATWLSRASVHLAHAVTRMPDRPEPHRLLAAICLVEGRLDESEHHVMTRRAGPGRSLQLAALYQHRASLVRRTSPAQADALLVRARVLATSAVTVLKAHLEGAPDDDRRRAMYARACVLAGRYADALGALRVLASGGAPPELGMLAQVHMLRARELEEDGDAEGARVQWLEALRVQPTDAAVLAWGIDRAHGDDPGAAAVRAALEGLDDTAARAFALGTIALRRGANEGARALLEQAVAGRPGDAASLNNLAWCLSQLSVDTERALELASQAARARPRQPAYHSTRATLLIQLGRWRDALEALRSWLALSPTDPRVHQHLVRVYGELGLPQQAALHVARAATLQGR